MIKKIGSPEKILGTIEKESDNKKNKKKKKAKKHLEDTTMIKVYEV